MYEIINKFMKTDLYYFIKNYLYFIVMFCIIFYIILYINHTTKNNIVIIETKIFMYLGISFLFIIISDILETPLESLKKFLLIIILSLILVYISNYLIEYYYKNNNFNTKIILALTISLVISLISIIYINYTFDSKNKSQLFNCFNYGVNKNFNFLMFLTIYLYIYKYIFSIFNTNTNLSDIITPSILGILLIFFLFCLIIYICLKLKIINRIQILNSYIALLAIFTFLSISCIHIFMSSLSTICTTNETIANIDEQERVCLLLFISIMIILWLDDTRNWHQIGSILFLIITVFTLYCIFYYATLHPSTSLLSTWLFIEWLIIIFYKKENSKNSLHYSFMIT